MTEHDKMRFLGGGSAVRGAASSFGSTPNRISSNTDGDKPT